MLLDFRQTIVAAGFVRTVISRRLSSCEVSLLFKHLVDDAGPNLPAPFHLDLVRRELG